MENRNKKDTCSRVFETTSANSAREKLAVKMRSKSSIWVVAKNKTVLVTSYKAATLFQSQKGKQFLLGNKLRVHSARSIFNLNFSLATHLHEDIMYVLVSLVQVVLFSDLAMKTRYLKDPFILRPLLILWNIRL